MKKTGFVRISANGFQQTRKDKLELKDALRRIVEKLNGIEIEDLTTAKKDILRIAQKALFNA